jgi:peptidoglycan/LPS O-acetylase OafA/YrhL
VSKEANDFQASPHMVVPDALRAFAITLVVLNHLFLIAHPVLGRPIRLGFLGIWGVNMFFVLSGFLLAREFVRALLGTRPFPKIDRFLTRRFLRIYPLYFVAVLVSVVLVDVFLHHVSTRVIIEHIFLLEGADAQAIFDLNVPLWTMGIDAAFYLALPLIMGAVFLATRRRLVCRSRSCSGSRSRRSWKSFGATGSRKSATRCLPVPARSSGSSNCSSGWKIPRSRRAWARRCA